MLILYIYLFICYIVVIRIFHSNNYGTQSQNISLQSTSAAPLFPMSYFTLNLMGTRESHMFLLYAWVKSEEHFQSSIFVILIFLSLQADCVEKCVL